MCFSWVLRKIGPAQRNRRKHPSPRPWRAESWDRRAPGKEAVEGLCSFFWNDDETYCCFSWTSSAVLSWDAGSMHWKRWWNQHKKVANRHPTCPSSLETLVIPPFYLRSATGDNLLLWDSGYTPSLRRSFLLGTADNSNVLSSCDNLIIDGTFKVAPQLFTQLLTGAWSDDRWLQTPIGLRSATWEATGDVLQSIERAGHQWAISTANSVSWFWDGTKERDLNGII